MERPNGAIDAIIRLSVTQPAVWCGKTVAEPKVANQPRERLANILILKKMEERERIRTFDTVSRVPR